MNTVSIIDRNQSERRLDHYIHSLYRNTPKSHIHKMIRTGKIRVNGKKVDASYRTQSGDHIQHPKPEPLERRSVPLPDPERIRRAILWETEDLLVVNKPSGPPVHAGSGYEYGWVDQLSETLKTPLYLVHRLDRLTSGVMLIAKHPHIQCLLSAQFKERSITKIYECITSGRWPWEELYLSAPLQRIRSDFCDRSVVDAQGVDSLSVFTLQEHYDAYSRVQVELMTGRMHQIRAHCAYLGHSILGDTLYGGDTTRLGLMLLAQSVSFEYQGERCTFNCDWPEEKRRWIETLKGNI